MQIYISRDSQQFGPYSMEQARDYMAAGSLQAHDLAWHDGVTDWMPLVQMIGVAPAPTGPRDWIPPRRGATSTSLMSAPRQVIEEVPAHGAIAKPVTAVPSPAAVNDSPANLPPPPARMESSRRKWSSTPSFARPPTVTFVGWILCVLGVFSVFGLFSLLFLGDNQQVPRGLAESELGYNLQLGLMVFNTVVTFVVGVNILQGENWARWLYVAFCAFWLVIELLCSPSLMMLVGIALKGLFIFLLFLPLANDYFRRR